MSVFSHNSLVRIAMEGHKSFVPGKISIDPQKQHTEAGYGHITSEQIPQTLDFKISLLK